MASAVRQSDGQFDLSGGVDSGRIPTMKSELTPNGLARNQLAWASNATVRGGGVMQRRGWKKLQRVAAGALYQSGWLYDPSTTDPTANPYLMLSIGGHIYQVRVDTNNAVVDISAVSGLTNPATEPLGFMCQGEEFLVIQAGDYTTLPLFWDGHDLRRSVGFQTPPDFDGATWTVPAIGGTCDITLTAAYAGATNAIFLLGGYQYMHLLYTQRLLGHVSALTMAPIAYPYTIPAGARLYDSTVPPYASKTLLRAVTFTGLGIDTNIYVDNGTIGTHPTWYYNDPAFPAQPIYLGVAANALAIPAANHIWAININDTRVGAQTNVGITSELPASGPMDYYMGRLWYAQDRKYTAGDIVYGPEGTSGYAFRDSILKVTENPLAVGGDGFAVPSNAGSIRAISHPIAMDASLGEGKLYVFTQKTVYSLQVPVTRINWIAANADTMPLQTLVQKTNGTDSDRSVVSHNGDLFYRSNDGIRSIVVARRDNGQWGNTPISANEERIWDFEDRTLMRYASGVVFQNRLYQTCIPVQTAVGVAFKGIMPLDFDLISSLQEKLPPAWEGIHEGLKILQLFEGDFSGHHRCFAVVVSDIDGGIDVWELTDDQRTDENDKRVQWSFETPSFTWGEEFSLKQLDGGELYVDRVHGCLNIEVYYRPDCECQWQFWHREEICVARTSCETLDDPVCYPETPYGEGCRLPVVLPKPPYPDCATMNKRPLNQGYQFQMKVKLTGHARVRGIILFALPLEKAPFAGLKG